MSVVDELYKNTIDKIIDSSESFRYEDVNRPGTFVRQHRNIIFSYGFYDGVPLITTKKTHLRIAVAELAWILSGSTCIKPLHDVGVKIWHKDALQYYNRITGSSINMSTFEKLLDDGTIQGELGKVYGHYVNGITNAELFTAINKLLHLLNNKPNSREKLVSMSNHLETVEDKAISNCHHFFEITNISENMGVLNFYMRSCDVFLGLPYNLIFYYLLADILTELSGFKIVGMMGNLSNAHIYEDHNQAVEELLTRDVNKIPKIDAKVHKDFYAYFNAVITEGKVDNSVSTLSDILNRLPKLYVFNHTQTYGAIKAEMIPYGF